MKNGHWKVPKIWGGETCIILGGGPSLKGLEVDRLRGYHIIAVNCAYRLGNWFDAMYFGDCRWLKEHGAGLCDFAGLKVTSCDEHLGKPGILVVKKKLALEGISTNPEIIAWNKSSGAAAINLAAHLGAGKIVLLGFDMRRVDGKTNFHNFYPPYGANSDPYEKFMRPFGLIARDLERLGIKCINATPDSALKVFPIMTLEEALCSV